MLGKSSSFSASLPTMPDVTRDPNTLASLWSSSTLILHPAAAARGGTGPDHTVATSASFASNGPQSIVDESGL
ncbi:hypothetical protein GWI33_002405 [Rhynchophorus ferrugineus]|uniref:Uncharacterized protein n=1 Tax=Rhynchophorus ferrugineus TaxID=354439 RepID=A0A834MHL0_RHYFE|nr:hypothetical protein GWI33_002405 [Rhynchophorus ferrugineus]